MKLQYLSSVEKGRGRPGERLRDETKNERDENREEGLREREKSFFKPQTTRKTEKERLMYTWKTVKSRTHRVYPSIPDVK